MQRTLPMFPLGSVLVPTGVLPLHVFEDRYRTMMHDVRAGDDEFGVVLIDRGAEVGGGEVRTDIGTVARVVEADELDDGRWVVIAAGTSRVRVLRWLPDDPYPQAIVEELVDADPGPDGAATRDEVATRLRRVLALASELGEDVAPATTEISDDPRIASYHALVLAPIGPLDTQRLLRLDDPAERLVRLAEALEEIEQDLRARMALEAEDHG